MMKMSGRVTGCCVALLLVLTSVSVVCEKLNSISSLKTVDFGQSVPSHSLLLLHWFANEVTDNNNVMWLNFSPDNGDFGSHHYGNYEGLLEPLPRGYTYYTVGNVNQETDVPLPSYVASPPPGYEGRNRDRIIIRVEDRSGRIDRVFITQHYSNSRETDYDPNHTYQITNNLIRQIRAFQLSNDPQSVSELINRFSSNANRHDIINMWGGLACLGLLLFIVMEEKYSPTQNNRRATSNNRPGHNSRVESNNGPGQSSRSGPHFQMYLGDVQDIYLRENIREDNKCCKCSTCCKWVTCSVFVLIFIAIALGIFFYFHFT